MHVYYNTVRDQSLDLQICFPYKPTLQYAIGKSRMPTTENAKIHWGYKSPATLSYVRPQRKTVTQGYKIQVNLPCYYSV